MRLNKKKKSTNISPYPDEASKEKQSVPDGERPVVHIAITCGSWQGASGWRTLFLFLPAAGEPTISMTALLELLKDADPEMKAKLRLALLT